MTVNRYLTGMRYPSLPMVRKIEEEFGWTISEQVRLMAREGKDHGYGIVLGEVLREHFGDEAGDISFEHTTYRPRAKTGAWTQIEVAEELGINKNNLNRWLGGHRYPDVKVMVMFQEVLDWPVAEQASLIPPSGYNTDYGDALREVLDRTHPGPEEV